MIDKRDRRILVVEDESLLQWSLVKRLRREGYRVRGVDSGEAALTHLEDETADLIILDINLPGMTGLEMLKTLRTLGQAWPVIVITAFDDASVRELCSELGVYELVGKPFKLEMIAEMVQSALEETDRGRRA